MKFPPLLRPLKARRHVAIWLLLAVGLAASGCGGHRRTHPLTSLPAPDVEMLRQYESIRSALAHDDLRAAKRTAADFQKGSAATAANMNSPVAPAVAKIAAAAALEPQREAFRTWSTYVIALTKDVQGFYVVHCPVPGCGDWLQTDPNVDNPYMGKAMHDCGEVEK